MSQLDFIVGQKRGTMTAFCNEGKLWDSWDHYAIYARSRKEKMRNNSPGKEKELVWMGTQDGGT